VRLGGAGGRLHSGVDFNKWLQQGAEEKQNKQKNQKNLMHLAAEESDCMANWNGILPKIGCHVAQVAAPTSPARLPAASALEKDKPAMSRRADIDTVDPSGI